MPNLCSFVHETDKCDISPQRRSAIRKLKGWIDSCDVKKDFTSFFDRIVIETETTATNKFTSNENVEMKSFLQKLSDSGACTADQSVKRTVYSDLRKPKKRGGRADRCGSSRQDQA